MSATAMSIPQDLETIAAANGVASDMAFGAVAPPTSHPGHEIVKAQQSGFGAMLSFDLAGGAEAARRFVESVEVFTLAESLGGVESLIAHPATMTHVGMSMEVAPCRGHRRRPSAALGRP